MIDGSLFRSLTLASVAAASAGDMPTENTKPGRP